MDMFTILVFNFHSSLVKIRRIDELDDISMIQSFVLAWGVVTRSQNHLPAGASIALDNSAQ